MTMMDVTDYLCIDFIIFNDFLIFISYCFTDFCFKIIHDRLHFIIHYSLDFFQWHHHWPGHLQFVITRLWQKKVIMCCWFVCDEVTVF